MTNRARTQWMTWKLRSTRESILVGWRKVRLLAHLIHVRPVWCLCMLCTLRSNRLFSWNDVTGDFKAKIALTSGSKSVGCYEVELNIISGWRDGSRFRNVTIDRIANYEHSLRCSLNVFAHYRQRTATDSLYSCSQSVPPLPGFASHL